MNNVLLDPRIISDKRIPKSAINNCLKQVRHFGTFSPVNKKETFEDVKPLPMMEQPTKSVSEYFNQQVKEGKFKMKTGLTFKSVLVLVLSVVIKTVLGLFFDESITTKIMELLQNLLNSVGGISLATALWGIRRRITDL